MSQNKDKKQSKNIIKPPKFNFYWVYGGIFLLFIVFQFLNSGDLATKKSTHNEFISILLDNDIERIEIINEDAANIYIKNEALTKDRYQKQVKSAFYSKNSPLFIYDFGDLQNFEKELKENQVANDLDFDKDYITKTNFLDQLFIYLPFIFLIGLWIYFMRRMSGGGAGGGGGQIFSIGKSKAKLFDQDQKVKTSFKDVAGLEGAKEEVKKL